MLLMTTFKLTQSDFCDCMLFFFITQSTIKRVIGYFCQVRLSVCHERVKEAFSKTCLKEPLKIDKTMVVTTNGS